MVYESLYKRIYLSSIELYRKNINIPTPTEREKTDALF